jgi:hypothetical protein
MRRSSNSDFLSGSHWNGTRLYKSFDLIDKNLCVSEMCNIVGHQTVRSDVPRARVGMNDLSVPFRQDIADPAVR